MKTGLSPSSLPSNAATSRRRRGSSAGSRLRWLRNIQIFKLKIETMMEWNVAEMVLCKECEGGNEILTLWGRLRGYS